MKGKLYDDSYQSTVLYDDRYQATAVNERIRFLVIHYTAGNFAESIAELTGPLLSVHYLIPDVEDQTYKDCGFNDMRIFRLADESKRAWHAGVSSWAGRTRLNDTSIGIEIVNLATENEKHEFIFPPFTKEQISAVKQLALDILERNPDISPVNVIGHSDIAPTRKSDPGPCFPWQELAESNIGAWYDIPTWKKYLVKFAEKFPSDLEIVNQLNKYGYDVSDAEGGKGEGYRDLLRAFQMHFHQDCKSYGELDLETAATLYALVEKYKE